MLDNNDKSNDVFASYMGCIIHYYKPFTVFNLIYNNQTAVRCTNVQNIME